MATATNTSGSDAAKKQAAKLKQLLADLKSGNETAVIGAVKELRVYGNDAAVEPLVDALVSAKNPTVYNAIKAVLFELKTPNAASALVAALRKPNTKGHRHVLVAAFWEAGLDAADHIDLLVELAITEDFQTCLECLTVLENLGSGFDEEIVFPLIKLVKDELGKDEQKDMLLTGMVQVLQDLVIG